MSTQISTAADSVPPTRPWVAQPCAAPPFLAATRQFDGTLNLIFQPAEEGQGGAEAMLAAGYSITTSSFQGEH